MPGRFVVYGQRVKNAKREAARRLRARMTPEEKLLWQTLRGRPGGLHFRRQQIIDGFIVDFYSNVAGLVIEVDGDSHLGQEDYDRDRDKVLGRRGIAILHFTNREILHDLELVMKGIAHAAQMKLPNSPPGLPSPERGGDGGGVP